MKRYLLFTGLTYYPLGGWHDWDGDFDTIEDAKIYISSRRVDWWDIVDTETKEVVECSS